MKNDNKPAGQRRQVPSDNVWQRQNAAQQPNNNYSPTLELEQLDNMINKALAAPGANGQGAPQRAGVTVTAAQNNKGVPPQRPAGVAAPIAPSNAAVPPPNSGAAVPVAPNSQVLPQRPAAVPDTQNRAQAPQTGVRPLATVAVKDKEVPPQDRVVPLWPQEDLEAGPVPVAITKQENVKEAAGEIAQTEELVQNEEVKQEQTEQEEQSENKKKSDKKGKFNPTLKKAVAVIAAFAILGGSSLAGFLVHQQNTKKVQTASAPNEKDKAKKVDVGKSLRTYTANKVKKQQSIPAYSFAQVQKLDLTKASGTTVADLKLVTRQGLVGLEQAFVNAEKKYGVNALFLVAIASLESANGTICFKPNNMFGYGSKGYDTKEDCIYDVASGLSGNYLSAKGPFYHGTNISAVHKRYASSSTWHTKVGNNMTNYYSIISASRKKALKKL